MWDKVHCYFQSLLRARVRQLRSELKTMKKGLRRVNEYLLQIKVIIDSLMAIGDSISDQNHMDAILDGLPDGKGMSFVCTLNFREVTSKNLEGIIIRH